MENTINKVVIFGANGMLGRYIYKYLSSHNINTISIYRNDYDAYNNDIEKLENIFIIKSIDKNTLVFNAIGAIPHQGIDDPQYYYKINSTFPIILSYLCNKYKCKIIHPTTDCVFSGNDGMYTETSKHDSLDHYGMSKSIGEKINACIIRTSIIGENNKGISLVEWVKSNKNGEINGYINHLWNGITCLQYAKIIYYMIVNNIYWNGVRHIYSPNTLSKADLIELINKEYKLNIKINKIKSNNCNRSLDSRYRIVFDIPKLEKQIEELYQYNLD